MTVVSSSQQSASRQVAQGTVSVLSHSGEPAKGNSFAELLRERDGASASARDDAPPIVPASQIDFSTCGRSFRAELSVADNAVRFDARPIVAPVASKPREVTALQVASESKASSQAEISEPAKERLTFQSMSVQSEIAQYLDGTVARGAAKGGPDGGHVGRRIAEPVRPTVAAGYAMRPGGSQVLKECDQAPVSRISSRAGAGVSRSVPASVAILPNEVIVTVRSISLTDAERATLLNDVKQLLSERGLGDRIIRIQERSGRMSKWP